MNAFTAVKNHVEKSGNTDEVLLLTATMSDMLATEEARITSAAITEVLCDRHPEIADAVADFMEDYETPLTFTQFLMETLNLPK